MQRLYANACMNTCIKSLFVSVPRRLQGPCYCAVYRGYLPILHASLSISQAQSHVQQRCRRQRDMPSFSTSYNRQVVCHEGARDMPVDSRRILRPLNTVTYLCVASKCNGPSYFHCVHLLRSTIVHSCGLVRLTQSNARSSDLYRSDTLPQLAAFSVADAAAAAAAAGAAEAGHRDSSLQL